MQLENRFTIDAPIEKAWEALNTPRTIAPCFPGATLTEYEGDTFAGTVKVKLGPISLTYKGKGTYVNRDAAAHRVVIEAGGRDSRGNGTANATVTGSMVADGPDRTAVTLVTDMTITGRPAQFGRGVLSDIADKIIGQFAGCVAEQLAPSPADAAATGSQPAGAAAFGSANGAGGGAGTATATVTATAPSSSAGAAATVLVPRLSAPMRSEIDAIDLLDTAGAPVLKRLAPVIGGAALLVIALLVRRWRSR